MEKNYKPVSRLLDKSFGEILLKNEGTRGKILHEAYFRFYKDVFKTSDKFNKINFRNYNERVYKAISNRLDDIQKSPKSRLYHEDAKILLNTLKKSIQQVVKKMEKENYGIVIPHEIELEVFGGEVSLEVEAIGKIGGFNIPARIDCIIELKNSNFIIRDFKSYEKENGKDSLNHDSQHHRAFMQVCLYAIIMEKERHQTCESIQLEYFPNKIISYLFTEELKEAAKKFAMVTAFEGFEGITFDFSSDNEDINEDINKVQSSPPEIPSVPKNSSNSTDFSKDDTLGWINTIKGKPLQLIMGQDNKMEGFLYPNKAYLVKDGYCVIVEKEEDGVRIMCIVKKIECSEDHYPGETASHKEENYKITLIPVGQFTPEGYQDLSPQTIIGGKIKIPRNEEFCEYKRIPQNGINIGRVQGLNSGISYPMELKTFYQSTFMSGQQDTGKTTALKTLTLQMAQEEYAPAIIILDNEGEYGDLKNIPTNKRSEELMKKYGIKSLRQDKFNYIDIRNDNGVCLSLKAIDPVDLPYFIHELTSLSHDNLQTIIYDIINNHNRIDFTLPKLIDLILEYMERESYGIAESTKSAIKRALSSISLRIFDEADKKIIDYEKMLMSGNITVINSFNLRDIHQRVVGLYLLSILHKRALKGKEKLRVIFILDEVQRLLPKSQSQTDSDYIKRIVKFLDEIVHRGRKRDYGVIFATQSVMDVKKAIIDLCNTKIFLQTQGSGINHIKEYISNKEDLERLKQLPKGHAFITSKGKHEPVEIRFPYIN